MGFYQTRFGYFEDECIKRFGADEGKRLFLEADGLLNRMVDEIPPSTGSVIKQHMAGNMLPTIAMYLVFKNNKSTSEKAYDNTLEIVQIAAQKAREQNSRLKNIPFAFQVFKYFCKRIIQNQFPDEGWNVVWRRYDKKEIHVDFTSCIYLSTCVKYGCPEVCPVFCANDDTAFSGYFPKIIFKRSSTLANGQALCDFHFINGKRK